MLYQEPFIGTLHRFADWLRSQPADEAYKWSSVYDCPATRFLGIEAWGNKRNMYPKASYISSLAHHLPRTYGALLQRVERKIEMYQNGEPDPGPHWVS